MRIGDKIWYANRVNEESETIPEYESPKEIRLMPNYFTVMPASARGYIELLKQGETVYESWVAVANARIFDRVIKDGAVFWVDGHSPITALEEKYGYGATANAQVKDIAPANLSITITLEKNYNQVLK